jgi:16S rRNA (cytosine967-C5)-methyltransferase
MLAAARVQAAIELLDLIIAAAQANGAAADTIIANWFKERRYAGSKDRRAVRDLVYRAIRAYGEPPKSGRVAMLGLGDLAEHFDGSPHGPPAIGGREKPATPSLLPAWLSDLIDDEDQPALLGRAPFDLRVNALQTTREQALPLFDNAVPIEGTSNGIRLPENIPLARSPDLRGLVEVQDAGSQLIAATCHAQPGQSVIDLCAGAGGKSLALSADMQAQGRLIACDTDRRRLARLPARISDAGARNIETLVLNPKREMDALGDYVDWADCVLVDAPCSGSGTWRRNPELRWRLTPQRLVATCELQAHVLDLAAPLVKPGGALVYAVCSVLDQEGAAQIDAFLADHPEFQPTATGIALGRAAGHGRLLTPHHDATDGFFIARLEKTC